jgi:hypothetical protein
MFGWVRDGKYKRSDCFYLTYVVSGTKEQNIAYSVSGMLIIRTEHILSFTDGVQEACLHQENQIN